MAKELSKIRELTDKPFAVNYVVPDINEESFKLTLEARPAVISFALGDPGEHVKRAHDIGSLVMHQVTTVQQAYQAAERGVDIIIAQGGEAGGIGGAVAAFPLIPQVVDAVGVIPVVAAGGIVDGRGLAAALLLGAVGVNLGTRFLATLEAPIDDDWKRAIVEGGSELSVKMDGWAHAKVTEEYQTSLRVLRTDFIDRWNQQADDGSEEATLRGEFKPDIVGRLVPVAGESAGLIKDILPAADIVRNMAAEAEKVLKGAGQYLK
jgi:nitronate monooxygenase/enoyl-[acyl-carrier protein] reductase II